MIGLSSVSYVKKSPSKDLPSISTSISSPRISSNSVCRSPFTAKRQQLPVFIRKQQKEEEEQEEEDDREIIKNNGNHNAYGVPTNNVKSQSLKQQQTVATQSDLNQKIRVCVRKRPLARKEIERCEKDITPVASVRTVHVNEPK